MSVQCNTCGDSFETYSELAAHIQSSPKRTHKHGRKWAAKLLLRVGQLDKKQEFENRTKLTEQEKENRIDTRRELSGQRTMVNTKCPQCKKVHAEALEVEYAHSKDAWRAGTFFMVLCVGCRRN